MSDLDPKLLWMRVQQRSEPVPDHCPPGADDPHRAELGEASSSSWLRSQQSSPVECICGDEGTRM